MGALKNIFLTFISIALVLAVFLFGILSSLHAFLYPTVYENALSKSNVYSSINFSKVPGGEFILLPAGGTKALLNSFIKNSLSYFRGESSKLNLTVSVNVNKVNALIINSSGIKACAVGQVPYQNGSICIPEGINSSQFIRQAVASNEFSAAMQYTNLNASTIAFLQNLEKTGQINLAQVMGLNSTNTQVVKNAFHSYKTSYTLVLILVIILALASFFVSESKTRWLGVSLFLAGIGVFILSTIVPSIPLNLPPSAGTFSNVVTDLILGFASRLKTYAIISFGLGILLFVVSFFIPKKKFPPKKQISTP